MTTFPYADAITKLPRIKAPVAGVTGWLSQGPGHQLVFFDLDPSAKIPPHSHGDQWGIVVEGEMELTIGGEARTYRRGDSYFIPAGVEHHAKFFKRTFAIDFFADGDRYTTSP